MTPQDQSLSATGINLIEELVGLFVTNFVNQNHQPFNDVLSIVYTKLDATGFFNELEIHKIDESDISLIIPSESSSTSASVFHETLFNNNLIQNKTSVFTLESSTVFLAYIHNITKPEYVIYANKKLNIQNRLVSSMLNAVTTLLSNLTTRYPI
ncbi:MAG: hypothetical protein ACTS9Y_00980 [Methylophilus sp.]|uniref:hypothetical protein n=1 Tax=Methylophilus sp. TaxID=29541 RepID=UPI003FA18597